MNDVKIYKGQFVPSSSKYAISEGGILGWKNNECIIKNAFCEFEAILALEDLQERNDFIILVSGVKHAYLERKNESYKKYFEEYYPDIVLVDDFTSLGDYICRFVVYLKDKNGADYDDISFTEMYHLTEELICFQIDDIDENETIKQLLG